MTKLRNVNLKKGGNASAGDKAISNVDKAVFDQAASIGLAQPAADPSPALTARQRRTKTATIAWTEEEMDELNAFLKKHRYNKQEYFSRGLLHCVRTGILFDGDGNSI